MLSIAEKALEEINHCYVLRIAGFRPGDHLLVITTMRGSDPSPRRYIVLDVVWSKGDSYYYEVQELTRSGAPHKGRHPTWISPSNRISIEYCKDSLSREAQSLADGRREDAKALLEAVLEEGDLSLFQPKPEAANGQHSQRQYPFWLPR